LLGRHTRPLGRRCLLGLDLLGFLGSQSSLFGGLASAAALACQRRPLVPSPDGKRRQAFLGRLCAIAEAVPAMDCCLSQEWNT
jgi:hypothetical protein